MEQKTKPMLDLVERIIDCDPQMRFAALIDMQGNIIEAIMNKDKTNLKSQQEEAHFCRQVAERRTMRKGFDGSLGRVRYVQVEREKLTQYVLYPAGYTVYFTTEPEIPPEEKMIIINKIKSMVAEKRA